MNKIVIITGGYGFIGQNVAHEFKNNYYHVIAIGHGNPTFAELEKAGIDEWHEADISLEALKKTSFKANLIVHCAGNGAVGLSISQPLLDFNKNVNTTLDVLEFIRVYCPETALIYLSSAAVYGTKEDKIINENDFLNPVSPYGFHKLAAETVCKSYSINFGLKIAIVRFFSIYGEGLQKQLLWEASNKILRADKQVEFYGSGEETRDWLYVKDAAKLISHLTKINFKFLILNGAYGERVTVKEVLNILLKELNKTEIEIVFNNQEKLGDPKYYLADMNMAFETGWKPRIQLSNGIKSYASWFKQMI